MSRGDLLFHKYELRAVMDNNEQKMYAEIDAYNSNRLLNTSTEDLAKYFIDKFSIEPIKILEENICVDQKETKIDATLHPESFFFHDDGPHFVTGTAVILEIPFTGDAELFKCRPSTFNFNPPVADIRGNSLIITISTFKHEPEIIRNELKRQINSINEYVEWINRDLAPWNFALPSKAKARIENRKAKLLKDQGLVSALGFPIKRRNDAIVTYAVPQVRRKIEPKMPNAGTTPYIPEPILVMEEYEYILSIIKMTARMLERSPHAFKGMNEEHLRDQFLVPLNSHYEGQASGETFNFNGKTDIIIQAEGKAIFIAECKIWRGQKAFSEAIDQLLGYTTWRDTKLSLIIFNRNKDLSNVIEKIPETVKVHSNFKRELQYADETGFRYVFAHRDDANRELILTILVFEVPA